MTGGAGTDYPRLEAVLERALAVLRSLQKPDGHWCGELQGDSILESEYILMKFILGQERAPLAAHGGEKRGRDGWETLRKIANYLRRLQRQGGGWGQHPGSAVDCSATVKAYFALKLMGDDPAAPHMVRARETVIRAGGAEQCNSFTNFYLACLGQISWNAVPAIPPELMFLPRWFYFHMTKVSAWTRTMILPLSLVVTQRPTRRVPATLGIDELFVDPRARHRMKNRTLAAANGAAARWWSAIFMVIDRLLKLMHGFGVTPLRRVAVRAAERWILDRAGRDGIAATAGLGAIFPPMVYIQIALQALGYSRAHPVIQRAEGELDALFIEDKSRAEIRIQPCFSPVWDTGIALYALTDCSLDEDDDAVRRAAAWLRSQECRHIGDWIANLPSQAARRFKDILLPLPSGEGRGEGAHEQREYGFGWYFEYANAWYPDCDDTAMVAMALRRAGGLANIRAAQRGVEWLLAMQNDDGGWAAFDRTRHRQILEYIPFADHNAMQDPSCPDITGRVLECLAWHGYDKNHPGVARAIEYLKKQQVLIESDERTEARRHIEKHGAATPIAAGDNPRAAGSNAFAATSLGCFFGRWGVNYIYGTWQAVIGPLRCGISRNEEWIQRAGGWIKSIQKHDGSFGESANSYEDPSLKGCGPSTASQTAWAAMILQEIYGPNDPDLIRAIEWLAETQLRDDDALDPVRNPDGDPPGSWVETEFTGTGFPRVFYLRYHLYRLYFPIMALGRYLAAHVQEYGGPRQPRVALREPIHA